jgi:hypothetical protein
MRQLATDAKMSLATVCRYLASMAALGVFQRERKPGGRYCYRLVEAYVPRWPGRVPRVQLGVSKGGTQQAKPAKHIFKRRFAEELPVDPWEQRLAHWRQSGFWLGMWGPKPNEAGCFAPVELLGTTIGHDRRSTGR